MRPMRPIVAIPLALAAACAVVGFAASLRPSPDSRVQPSLAPPAALPVTPASAVSKPTAPPICFGAFPRESTRNTGNAGHAGVIFRQREGLDLLGEQTSLAIRGDVVYIPVTAENATLYRGRQQAHYLTDEDIQQLAQLVQSGIVLRISLEPGYGCGAGALQALADGPDVLVDLAGVLADMGPCTMRVASELNLYDSPYHVSPRTKSDLEQLGEAFAAVHEAFSQIAPNVTLTFSSFIPNDPDEAERDRCLRLVRAYLPYVIDHVDMITGTFYPRSPGEVAGLVAYADMVKSTGKPFGIDELGCRDEATFRKVMELVAGRKLGDLRYINFFDYHVETPGIDNPWHLKEQDKRLLRELKEQGKLVDE